MKCAATLFILSTFAAGTSYAQEQRELDAHVHGESALNIAVEGNSVSMQLEAPAMDIVGFEHDASTEEQKAAIVTAREKLSDPLAIFVMPSGAGCTVAKAEVEHHFGDDHEEEEGHAGGEVHVEGAGAEEAVHSEFQAAYELTCTDADAITVIDFSFFERFPDAEAVDVQVVSSGGQSSYEVTREAPRLSLTGSM
jgi:hypothetical protein